jgi:hypothetical protein
MSVPRLISSAVARPHEGMGYTYLRCCSLPTMDQPLPLAPGVVPTAVLGEGVICSGCQ